MGDITIIDTNPENILEYGMCGYKSLEQDGFRCKIDWIKDRITEGMKIKTLHSEKDGTQGMIEYIPGEYAWRPVDAKGYMFIHCIFVGFKKVHKGKGYGALLVDVCIKDAKDQNMHGVAVTTREGSFMQGKEIFLKKGFEIVDTTPPDFELLVKYFDKKAPAPKFKDDWEKVLVPYQKGLTIFRSDQCPYLGKNVPEIIAMAEDIFKLKPRIIELKSASDAQNSPCPFGIFCIAYEGQVIAHHPISKTRFRNIMQKLLA